MGYHKKIIPILLVILFAGIAYVSRNNLTALAAPPVGNIVNLNFGISNFYPWIQVTCGDIRIDNGISNNAPAGQVMSTTNPTCTSPGIIFSGDSDADFGSGQASSSNQVVGSTTYPEVFQSSGPIVTSYSYLTNKASSAKLTEINLTSICSLSNCTLPANLPHGIYTANGNVSLNRYTFSSNANYIFLINGALTFNGNIIVPVNANSSVLFSASGNIVIPASVGGAASATTANLTGILSTDRSFILQSTNSCNDLRLNIEGTVVVNAARSGGTFQNNRDLCGADATAPTMEVTQRLDFILNLPEFIRSQQITSQEVAP